MLLDCDTRNTAPTPNPTPKPTPSPNDVDKACDSIIKKHVTVVSRCCFDKNPTTTTTTTNKLSEISELSETNKQLKEYKATCRDGADDGEPCAIDAAERCYNWPQRCANQARVTCRVGVCCLLAISLCRIWIRFCFGFV
jgi:hypothetical protein